MRITASNLDDIVSILNVGKQVQNSDEICPKSGDK